MAQLFVYVLMKLEAGKKLFNRQENIVNMKRCIIFLIAVGLSVAAYTQEREALVPDYSSIKELVQDPNSLFFYPHLLAKYERNDTTLSLREYRMLYYGFFFDKKYENQFNDQATDDSLKALLAKDNMSTKDWTKVLALDKQYLSQRPFELKKLNIAFMAYKKLGDSAMANIYLDKVRKIAYAILSSGDGQSEATALHVLQISDEYSLINMLGYEFGGTQELTTSQCDFLSLKDNPENIKGLYFDVKQIFKGYERSMIGSSAQK